MKKLINRSMRYGKLYYIFVRSCLIAQMEFRVNFFISVFIEMAFILVKLLYVIVVFGVGVDINGLSPYEILMFIGSYTMITGIMDAVYFPNVSKLPSYIRQGDLDLFITKPISLKFMVSFRYFDFGLAVPNVITGIAMIIVAFNHLSLTLTISGLLGYIALTLVGIIVAYPILYIPALLSFWVVKTDSVFDIIWAMWDFNNMPMGIYGKWLQRVGVFIFPLFVITNFAPLFIFGELSVIRFVWAFVAAALFIGIFSWLWSLAIKNYTSASS